MSHPISIAAFQPDLAPNLGSLLRLGVCFGIPVHVIEPCGFPFSLKLVRTRALDYAEKADVRHHDDWSAFMNSKPGRKVLLTTKGADSMHDFAFRTGDCLIFGRESAGVPEDVHAAVDARIYIPMPGEGRSLNIAVSAGIAASEALRQLKT